MPIWLIDIFAASHLDSTFWFLACMTLPLWFGMIVLPRCAVGTVAGATFASGAALLRSAFCIVMEVVSRFAVSRPYGRAQLFSSARTDAPPCRISVILL